MFISQSLLEKLNWEEKTDYFRWALKTSERLPYDQLALFKDKLEPLVYDKIFRWLKRRDGDLGLDWYEIFVLAETNRNLQYPYWDIFEQIMRQQEHSVKEKIRIAMGVL